LKTGSTNNFPIIIDTDVVQQPKWYNQSSRIHVPSATVGDNTFYTEYQAGGQERKVESSNNLSAITTSFQI